MFAENEYARTLLENLVKDYNTNKKNNDRSNYTNSKKIWWVPNIVLKLRKYFKKVNKDIIFTSGKNLQSILFRNKPNLLPKGHPGVHQLDCSWNGKYIGNH